MVEPTDRVRVSRNDGAGMGPAMLVSELLGLGGGAAQVGSTLSAQESIGNARTTKLTLTNFPVPVTSVTTGNGVGGALIYQFPAGFIKRLGCRASLSVTAETEADFTDGTPEGDLGIGTVAPANADALGTDATDDDWATATAFTMTDYVDSSVVLPTEADGVHDGSSSAIELYLNALVDAADIDDDVTTNLLVSGDIWISWLNQGG